MRLRRHYRRKWRDCQDLNTEPALQRVRTGKPKPYRGVDLIIIQVRIIVKSDKGLHSWARHLWRGDHRSCIDKKSGAGCLPR